MAIGFDVYHCGKRRGASVGAIVATKCGKDTRYYSDVIHHTSKEELCSHMGASVGSKSFSDFATVKCKNE